MRTLLIFILSLHSALSSEYLGDIPIDFSISGNISYTPTSGGASLPGYIMNIGFNRYPWLAIKFNTPTSRSIYDVIVLQRQTVTTTGYYKVTLGDYFVSASQQQKLNQDSNNNMDKKVQEYTSNNYFGAQIYRTKGDTQGQDWQGTQFVQICFYTSQRAFDAQNWMDGAMSSCYGYDISTDYVSTFRGKYIQTMKVDGTTSSVYGGIEGPVLQLIIFWYCPKSTLSSQNIYFQVGTSISEDIGLDFYKCGSGDYFGNSLSSILPDTQWSGYNDGSCSVVSSSTGTKLSYTRKVFTGDEFDAALTNQTRVCAIVGETEQCETLNFELLCPIVDVESSLIVFEKSVAAFTLAIFVTLLFLY